MLNEPKQIVLPESVIEATAEAIGEIAYDCYMQVVPGSGNTTVYTGDAEPTARNKTRVAEIARAAIESYLAAMQPATERGGEMARPFVWWSDASNEVHDSIAHNRELRHDERNAYLSAVEISCAIPLYTRPQPAPVATEQKGGEVALTQHEIGLYPKFKVSRIDGRDQLGGDRVGADYLVLDLTFDAHASTAALAYADICREGYPKLADDIVAKVFAPRQVIRDECGFWYHPCIDWVQETHSRQEVVERLDQYGYELKTDLMERYPDSAELYEVFDRTGDLSCWEPQMPSGKGWMLAGICDTEEGPIAVWLCKKEET